MQIIFQDNRRTDSTTRFRVTARRVTCAAVLFGLFAAPATIAREVEPNDTLATATPIGLTGVGSVSIPNVYLGNSEWLERDVDIYAFEIDGGAPLPVLVTAEIPTAYLNLDAYLRLFDASGEELVNNDDTSLTDNKPTLQTYLLAPGTYYVGAGTTSNPVYDPAIAGSGREGTGGGYALTITIEPATMPQSLYEPNDSLETAYAMGSDSFSILGEFIGDGEFARRDVDIYTLIVTGPARLDIRVRAEANGSPLDPVVQLAGILGSNDDGPNGSVDSSLVVGVSTAQNVHIAVFGAGNARLRTPSHDTGEPGSVGPYDLIVDVTYFDGSAQDEPNDSIDTARAFYPNPWPPQVYRGFLGDGPFALTRGDRDFFQLPAPPSSTILMAEVIPINGTDLNPTVSVYDQTGQRLAISDAYGPPGRRYLATPIRCGVLDYPGSSSEMFYLMVGPADQRAPVDPFVPLSRTGAEYYRSYEDYAVGDGPGSTGDYQLTVQYSQQPCGLEPNNTLITAAETGLVDEGSFVCAQGGLDDGPCSPDVDMWSVVLEQAPATLTVYSPACEDYYSDYALRVFDFAGNELALATYNYFPIPSGVNLSVALDTPGTYFVGLSDLDNVDYDPTLACSGSAGGNSQVGYDMWITLIQPAGAPHDALTDIKRTGGGASLFATRLDDAGNMIDVLDPQTGQATASFEAPESGFGGSEGVASDASYLYYVGAGRYPMLYTLDTVTGTVLDQFVSWFGSGHYSDAAMLGGRLYVLDHYEHSIHVVDPIGRVLDRTLDVGSMNTIAIGGGLASLTSPARLYVADAFNSRAVYEVDPVSGTVTDIAAETVSDPCCVPHGMETHNPDQCSDAECRFIVCEFAPHCCSSYPYEWGQWCADLANQWCSACTTGGKTVNRPTALGAIGDEGHLYVADWDTTTMEVIDRDGGPVADLALTHPVGSCGGQSFVGPIRDCNDDGIPDMDNIATGASVDCNDNGIPDECDLTDGASLNCNANEAPDECEADCNHNGIPDDCDIAGTFAGYPDAIQDPDCNANDIPDVCEADCNRNDVPDDCDVTDGTSDDTDDNGVPDECERVLYVDADAPDGGDGSNWLNPLNNLQTAIATAANRELGVHEIHVAQGLYTPAPPDGDRAASFRLLDGVAILGGYRGADWTPSQGRSDPNERDPSTFVAILSGDLNDNDADSSDGNLENSYHVVVASGVDRTAKLDGFTITAGLANAVAWGSHTGAGMFIENGSPTISRCVITANEAEHALFSFEGPAHGGGVFSIGGDPKFVECTFAKNLTSGPGGAVSNIEGDPVFVSCIFARNAAYFRPGGGGGAISNIAGKLTLIDCTFVGNTGAFGGAIRSESGEVSALRCRFIGHPNAGGFGTSIGCRYADISLVNCIFAADEGPGEVIRMSGGRIRLAHSTVLATAGPTILAGSFLGGPGEILVTDSILRGEIINDDESLITVNYSDVIDAWSGPGLGNISVEPLFIREPDPGPDGEWGTEDDDFGDLHVQPGSPTINRGDPTLIPEPGAIDMAGAPRLQGCRIDMGAYESDELQALGDFDDNTRFDLADVAGFQLCIGAAPDTPGLDSLCHCVFDLDDDGAVSIDDFADFQPLLTGP